MQCLNFPSFYVVLSVVTETITTTTRLTSLPPSESLFSSSHAFFNYRQQTKLIMQ